LKTQQAADLNRGFAIALAIADGQQRLSRLKQVQNCFELFDFEEVMEHGPDPMNARNLCR
jgi:hypothetical protein